MQRYQKLEKIGEGTYGVVYKVCFFPFIIGSRVLYPMPLLFGSNFFPPCYSCCCRLLLLLLYLVQVPGMFYYQSSLLRFEEKQREREVINRASSVLWFWGISFLMIHVLLILVEVFHPLVDGPAEVHVVPLSYLSVSIYLRVCVCVLRERLYRVGYTAHVSSPTQHRPQLLAITTFHVMSKRYNNSSIQYNSSSRSSSILVFFI